MNIIASINNAKTKQYYFVNIVAILKIMELNMKKTSLSLLLASSLITFGCTNTKPTEQPEPTLVQDNEVVVINEPEKAITSATMKESRRNEIVESISFCERGLFILKEMKSANYNRSVRNYKSIAANVNNYLSVRNTLLDDDVTRLDQQYLKSIKSACDRIYISAELAILRNIPQN
ncbi:hypothetical protein [Plesiomonas sp.]|uniref:hypothetical protein n=1 Tax=Plesiomonas sp. TaxID=2486279 RepID=UPI003F36FD20